jgi:hypothetical protein
MPTRAGEILLNNNQATYANLLSFYTKTFKGALINYSVMRGNQVEQGEIHLTYNRFTNTAQIVTVANFDETGVLFCASVDEEYVRVLYISSNTGVAPIFKHSITYFPL